MRVDGPQELDFVALEKSTLYEEPFEPTHPVVVNFWSVLHSFTQVRHRACMRYLQALSLHHLRVSAHVLCACVCWFCVLRVCMCMFTGGKEAVPVILHR